MGATHTDAYKTAARKVERGSPTALTSCTDAMDEQARENLEYLQAHVETVDAGLRALMDLLQGLPQGQLVRAASMRTLLAPLAAEAQQAAPLVLLLGGDGMGVLQ